ncbi:glycosyltransferase family 2 protein [Megasphaera sp.]|uniref:glycosyltransferase family 2 protein n=1 Tax=Megasphaera sp. TaxID=2023260 RepID=UPI00351FBA4B
MDKNKNSERHLVSILVPCYNEEAVLHEFYRRTVQVIDNIPQYDFQFMFVNDGSRDHTLDIMRELHEKDRRVSYVNLSRNFGKEIAMIAGIDYLTGDAAIIMDADLQDPPELIPEMISWWEKGYQDVSAKRRSRAGESFFTLFIRFCRRCPAYPCSAMSAISAYWINSASTLCA